MAITDHETCSLNENVDEYFDRNDH